MRGILVLFFILILFASCNGFKSKEITVVNNIDVLVDSVEIRAPGVVLIFTNISPGTSITKTFKMTEKINSDGAFFYTLYKNDSIKAQGSFGYFVNYDDINSKYLFTINKGFKIKAR